MEQLITQAKKQFDDILSYVQEQAQGQQLNEVEKGIFYALLKLGMTLLLVFFQQKGIGHKGKVHIDKEGTRRPYHSIKHREYLSIFGKVSIPRACYWAKGRHEIYPLDAELNLPGIEYSYVLQAHITQKEQHFACIRTFLILVLILIMILIFLFIHFALSWLVLIRSTSTRSGIIDLFHFSLYRYQLSS